MENSKKLIAMLIRHEGKRTHPYKCPSGKLTIGIGHNIEDNGLSDKVINLILREDIGNAIKDLCSVFPDFYRYGGARRCALIDMMFNMGLPTFCTFKNMIRDIKGGYWISAASEAIKSDWALQVGKRADEIAYMLSTNKFKEE